MKTNSPMQLGMVDGDGGEAKDNGRYAERDVENGGFIPKLAAFVASEEGLATPSSAGRKNLTNAR